MSRYRVLLVSPPYSYRIAAYLQAASLADIELIIASEGKYSLMPALASGIQVRLNQPDQAFQTIINALAGDRIDGVLSPDDRTAVLAAKIAAYYQLNYNQPEATVFTRRKDLARQKLAATSLLTPEFCVVDLAVPDRNAVADIGFPLVLKPLAMSGSRGVIRVNNWCDFDAALLRIGQIVRAAADEVVDEIEYRQVLAEKYIPGREYAVEGLLSDGRLELLAVFSKPDPLEGPYFEETYYISPSDLSELQIHEIQRTLQTMCAAYGLRQGPVHAELRINNESVWPIELAARTIGGQCAKLIELKLNQSLESLVLANLLGLEVNRSTTESDAVGVLMIPIPQAGLLRRVEGVREASQIPFIEHLEISTHTGYELIPLPEGNSYLGFIFAKGPTPNQVEAALRAAHACLKIVVNPPISVK